MRILPIKIKQIRKKHGYTQEDFANILGIPLRTYLRYEKGETNMPIHFAQKMADIGNIDEDFFFTAGSHQNQSGSNNIQVGGNMGNIDRPTPTQQTQIPKNQYCIEDEEVAALCFSAYTSAKALGRVDKLKLYLASAVPEILK